MLNLWRDIMSMKRQFSEIQSATQRDLHKLRNEVSSASNDMVATCSSLLTNTAQSMAAAVMFDVSFSLLIYQFYPNYLNVFNV